VYLGVGILVAAVGIYVDDHHGLGSSIDIGIAFLDCEI
jgi:hypothetical protein